MILVTNWCIIQPMKVIRSIMMHTILSGCWNLNVVIIRRRMLHVSIWLHMWIVRSLLEWIELNWCSGVHVVLIWCSHIGWFINWFHSEFTIWCVNVFLCFIIFLLISYYGHVSLRQWIFSGLSVDSYENFDIVAA